MLTNTNENPPLAQPQTSDLVLAPGHEGMTGQKIWGFFNDPQIIDRPCRTCVYASADWGISRFGERSQKLWWICGVGKIIKTSNINSLPVSCTLYKEGEREVMGLLDFKNRSQEEIEDELRRIREERAGKGKKKRTASRTTKIKKAVKQKKEDDSIDLGIL